MKDSKVVKEDILDTDLTSPQIKKVHKMGLMSYLKKISKTVTVKRK